MTDESDWRTEGTKANLRVEYLLTRANFWLAVSMALLAILIIGVGVTALFNLAATRIWLAFIWIANYTAVLAAYHRGYGFLKRIDVWTEDE